MQAKVEARNLARTKAKHTNALQRSDVFSKADEKSIAVITDQMKYEMHPKGSVICKQGDEANFLYLIISGNLVNVSLRQ